MGAYPNRSGRHADKQQSVADDTSARAPSRMGEQANSRASNKDANAIEPITIRVPDTCRYIGVSRSTLYVLVTVIGCFEGPRLLDHRPVLALAIPAMGIAPRPFARVWRGMDRAGCHNGPALDGQADVALQACSDITAPDLLRGRDGN